ncbi:MAG: OsmC family protein [Anaerolineales bacterium]
MDAKVTWSEGMSFSGRADTGFDVPLGADPSVGGANDGFRPLELMAVSLAGCTAMDVISILRKKQQAVQKFEVKVHADQPEQHPHVFTHVVIEYHIGGEAIDEAAVRRAIELSALKYCPAQAMLGKVVPMDLNYLIYAADGRLEKQGSWQPQ